MSESAPLLSNSECYCYALSLLKKTEGAYLLPALNQSRRFLSICGGATLLGVILCTFCSSFVLVLRTNLSNYVVYLCDSIIQCQVD